MDTTSGLFWGNMEPVLRVLPNPRQSENNGKRAWKLCGCCQLQIMEKLTERGLINKNTCYFILQNGGSSTVGALAQNSVIFLTFPSCSYKGCNCSRHYGLTQQWPKAGTEILSQKTPLHFLLNSFGQDICD